MRRPRSTLEGKKVEMFATGFDYPVTGRINRIKQEIKFSSDESKWVYELETDDGFLYMVDVEEVCWVSTKKETKRRPLKVAKLHAIKME